jgi:hypothetical protein
VKFQILCHSIPPFLDFLFQWTNDWCFCQILGAFSSHASLPIGVIEPKGFFLVKLSDSPLSKSARPFSRSQPCGSTHLGFPCSQQTVALARIFESQSGFTCRSAPGLDLASCVNLAGCGRSCTSLIFSAFITAVAFCGGFDCCTFERALGGRELAD